MHIASIATLCTTPINNVACHMLLRIINKTISCKEADMYGTKIRGICELRASHSCAVSFSETRDSNERMASVVKGIEYTELCTRSRSADKRGTVQVLVRVPKILEYFVS